MAEIPPAPPPPGRKPPEKPPTPPDQSGQPRPTDQIAPPKPTEAGTRSANQPGRPEAQPALKETDWNPFAKAPTTDTKKTDAPQPALKETDWNPFAKAPTTDAKKTDAPQPASGDQPKGGKELSTSEQIGIAAKEGFKQVGDRVMFLGGLLEHPIDTVSDVVKNVSTEIGHRYDGNKALGEKGPAAALGAVNETLNPLAHAKQAADRAERAERAGDREGYIRGKVQEVASLADFAMMIEGAAKGKPSSAGRAAEGTEGMVFERPVVTERTPPTRAAETGAAEGKAGATGNPKVSVERPIDATIPKNPGAAEKPPSARPAEGRSASGEKAQTEKAPTEKEPAEKAPTGKDPAEKTSGQKAPPPGMSRNEMKEPLSRDRDFPNSLEPNVKQPGVDLVGGIPSETWSQQINPKTGQIEVGHMVEGGEWIQLKRLESVDQVETSLASRIDRAVDQSFRKFDKPLQDGRSARSAELSDGTKFTEDLRNPETLRISIEVEGFDKLKPAEQQAAQARAQAKVDGWLGGWGAPPGTFRGKPVSIKVVAAP
jgi:hypothetical protein